MERTPPGQNGQQARLAWMLPQPCELLEAKRGRPKSGPKRDSNKKAVMEKNRKNNGWLVVFVRHCSSLLFGKIKNLSLKKISFGAKTVSWPCFLYLWEIGSSCLGVEGELDRPLAVTKLCLF